MNIYKNIIFILLTLFLYLLQTSFPYHLEFLNITPNLLVCFLIAITLFYGHRKSWLILIAIMILSEQNSELPFGAISIFIITIIYLLSYLKNKFVDINIFYAFGILFSAITFEALLVAAAYFLAGYDLDMVVEYLVRISAIELALNTTISTLFLLILILFSSNKNKLLIKE